MPEGSSNYPLWSQQILRAARAGRILKSQEIIRSLYRKNAGDDDKDVEAEDGGDGVTEDAKRGVKRNAQGFQVKKWSQLSRQQEESFPEYLAPRRAGLPSIHRIPAVNPNNMRQTRVRRVDAANQPVIYEVLIAEGKTIDGETTEQLQGDDELVVRPAPGTMITGLGVANEHGVIVLAEAPVPLFGRGRPPPPRKKGKRGPGRGKKKVDFGRVSNTITVEDGTGTATDGVTSTTGDVTIGNAHNIHDGATPAAGEDEGEEGEDDEDDEGDGEGEGEGEGDGEDGEVDADAEGEHDDDREEGELTPGNGGDPQDASQILQQFKSSDKSLPPSSNLPTEVPTVSLDPPPQTDVEAAVEPAQQTQETAPTLHDNRVNEPVEEAQAAQEPQQPLQPQQQPQQPGLTGVREPFKIPGLSLEAPSMHDSAQRSTAETARPTDAGLPPTVDLFGSLERGLQEADDDREEGEIE